MTTPQSDHQRHTGHWLVLVLTVVVSLLAAPIAAAVGTAVYDSRSQLYAEQAQTRRMVTATVIDSPARSDTITVRARWFAAGAEHTGAVKAQPTVKPGDSIDIWVDKYGSHVGPSSMSAVDEAVAAALAIWLGVATAAAAVIAGTRAVLKRVRRAGWQPDFGHLAANGGRRTRMGFDAWPDHRSAVGSTSRRAISRSSLPATRIKV